MTPPKKRTDGNVAYWWCPRCKRREPDITYIHARYDYDCLGRPGYKCAGKLSQYHARYKSAAMEAGR